jgi:hypothetical protein
MPENNLPPQGEDPKTECDLDILLVKLTDCLPDDIGGIMLPDHKVVKKILKKENPNLTDEEIEVMVEDPDEFEEIEEEPNKKFPKRKKRRKRKFPDEEPPQTPKDDGTPPKPKEETKKKKKKYKSCYEEYQVFEKQYENTLDDLLSKRQKLLRQRPEQPTENETINGENQNNVQFELEQVDKEISDLQAKKINAEEKKNLCLKNLIELPDEEEGEDPDKSGGVSKTDLVFACKAARDEIKKYNSQIRKLERARDEIKKQNDTVRLQSINSEIQRIEKLKKDLKSEKCKKGYGGSSDFNAKQYSQNLGGLGLPGIPGLPNIDGLSGLNIPGFNFRSSDFPPFPKMKLSLPEIEQAAIDFGSPIPLKFPNILFKQAQELKLQLRICVSGFLKLFKDLVVDLVKLAIKLATGIPGAVILLAPPSFNIPGAISFVMFIVDAVSDIIKRVASAPTYVPCLKKLNLVLPDVNFCNYVTTINVALKFFNALCLRLKKLDLLICKIISKIINKIRSRKKSTIKKLEKEKTKKQEEIGELQTKLNNTSDETEKKKIQDEIDGVNEDIKDLDKRIEKVKNQQDSANSSEQANMSKNLIGAAACLVPLLALLKKQDYSDDEPGEVPLTDPETLPPLEDYFEPVKEELDRVLTYVYDVMFEDGSMLYDVSKEYIDELRKMGYNVILNF